MTSLRLTAILPNYNHARYLPTALESVIAQKRPPDQLIIVDDASTDDSVAVIQSFLPRLPNVRFERNMSNVGAIAIINRGIAETDASIVCSVNADDVLYPDFFAQGMALLERFPEAAFFSARANLLDEAGNTQGVFATPVPLNKPGLIAPDKAARLLMRDDGWFMGNASLYRRVPLMEFGGFPADLHSLNDGFVARILALRLGACYSPAILAGWRRLAGGMAWSQTADFSAATRLAEVVEQRMNESCVFPPNYPERWRRRYLFGARRFGLAENRRRAAAEKRTTYAAALFREWTLTPYWFVRLRPFDLVAVTERRLKHLLAWDM